MTDFAAAAERLVQAYNAKDFKIFTSMISPDLDFEHFSSQLCFPAARRADGDYRAVRRFAHSGSALLAAGARKRLGAVP